MLRSPPAYFEAIQQKASERWDQLEADPELAGPWHQLFEQVQSPRHILSELLQNADDAGATEAFVRIEDGAFIFEHNGEDFREEHFASLCRFGYSNKRALHTIGFRGIGFKSTFSLGKCVELLTPTLAVSFEDKRFTEPRWLADAANQNDLTTVRVVISDDLRKGELEKNLQEWLASPLSLLFFKNVRRITVGDREVHWRRSGEGPLPNTEWLSLQDDPEKTFLVARSAPEPFPEDALDEIKRARMLAASEDAEFPPCIVEIVLGVEGRLYVVLPTGVQTKLPFACNAPFIQDPARVKIKDPETSPTNRWLLKRCGKLAAEAMLGWLGNADAAPQERAAAYDLMPDIDRSVSTLEGVCATIVEESFDEAIQEKNLLLLESGELVADEAAVIIPRALHDVWPGGLASALLDDDGRPPLSLHVSEKNTEKLLHWNLVKQIDDDGVLDALRSKHLPRPASWRQLLGLWVYLAPSITGWRYRGRAGGLNIVPVQGKDVLWAADDSVRLGEKKLLPSEEDWAFLGDRLVVLNQNWLRYLTEQRRLAETNEDETLSEAVAAADKVLEAVQLDEPSDTGRVIQRVADDFFEQDEVRIADVVRLTQIAARLGAEVDETFQFVTADGHLRSASERIVFDVDNLVDLLLPEEWCEEHLLHPEYVAAFKSCSREEWLRWATRAQSKLWPFVPIEEKVHHWVSKSSIEKTLRSRAYAGQFEPRYSHPSFKLNDWDFPAEVWDHWEELAKEDPSIWGRIAEKILLSPDWYWSGSQSASVAEIAQNGHSRRIVRDGLVAAWICRLQELACLPDTHGSLRKPAELLRRTPETESLIDVESFIHGRLDMEATRPLLDMLGVGSTPTGPDKLIQRLRALAQAKNAPAHEVEKWYRRLDGLIGEYSTSTLHTVRHAFASEKLILTESGAWEMAAGVFLRADEEDAPGAETIRAGVRDLSLWQKVGVADRPTVDLAIAWLNTLRSGKAPSAEELRRVRALLARHPQRIWAECEHWLTLSGEWVSIPELRFTLTMQPLIATAHLHPWVKQATADFKSLPVEVTASQPFASLPLLAAHIEERLQRDDSAGDTAEARPWLRQLGLELERVVLDDDAETARVRALGAELSATKWRTTTALEILPYIDGKPAGTPRRTEAVWTDCVLYAEDKPIARLALAVAQELARAFRRPELIDAIKLCYDREPAFVTDYMEGNFDLLDRSPAREQTSELTDDELNEGHLPAELEAAKSPYEPVTKAAAMPEPVAEPEQGSVEDDALIAQIIDPPGDDDHSDDSYDRPDEAPPAHPRQKPRQQHPDIMERFASGLGFHKDDETRFFSDDGRWIAKANGELFPWELRSASGEVLKHYWPKDHCIEREPLQLGADIWNIIEKQPGRYSLVLRSPADDPIELTGQQLRELRDTSALTLHPSTYRLVYENEQ